MAKMDLQKVKILKIEQLTHDTKSFIIEKPSNYNFAPGQFLQLAVDKDGWRGAKRSFTMSSAPNSDFLELVIKEYSEKHGVTEMLHNLKAGDKLLISKPLGKFDYDKSKNSVFIAAGSAITKFLSLLRTLTPDELKNIKFIYSNKTRADIILEDELRSIFSKYPENLALITTRENIEGYINGRINEELLRKYVDKDSNVSVCGPAEFIKDVMGIVRKIQGS